MIFAVLSLLLAAAPISSADAVVIVLNSKNSVSAKTFSEAKGIVEKDAAAGGPLQQFVIGVTTDDKKLAEKYLNASREKIKMLAEEKGNPLAWYLLSMEKNDLRLLQKAADGGNVQALNALGALVTQKALASKNLSTNAVESLLAQSFENFRQAAVKKDSNGYINLGTCYLRGFGCQRDMELAFVCFKAAAEAGHPEGMDNMSACYQFGHGVEKNDELSLLWAIRGRAARGDAAAAKWLETRK